ncbi:MAG: ABC transporter ATP-binding protein [Ruminococcaceae bacterium]|nr:ABC transporter ATP-binding protein [Oscillospiraceae bacterium]
MSTRQEIFNNQPLPDYEPLFNQNADEVKKTPFKILTRILSSYWARLLFSMFMFIIKTSPAWIIPILTANIINVVTDGGKMSEILINAAILAVLVLQNIPTHIIYARHTDKTLRNIGAGLRNTMVKKLQHLSITYHKEIESGRLQSKFLRDIEAIEFFNTHFLKTIIPSVITVIAVGAFTVIQSPIVALFYVFIIPVNVVLVRAFRKKMSSNHRMFRKENENMSANMSTMIEMIPVTKAHGLENEEIAKLENNIQHLKKAGFIVDRTIAYFGSMSWATNQILSAVCLIFTAYLAMNGKIAIGDIVMYQSFFTMILNNVQSIVGIFPELSKGLESVRSVSEILLSDKVEETQDKTKIKSLRGDIVFDNVSYRYPDGDEDIIKDFSLDIKQGECVAFVGASGSGKSTIINMIIGFLLPKSGKLTIDGQDITKMHLPDYRHNISVVPQSTILFTGTIKENILYGVKDISKQRFDEIVESANINEFLPQLPNGLETVIGEHGDKLSGGQKQRISIARALIRDPRILILDEATSALDNISEHHVQEAISRLIAGRTTFIVAHRLSTIRNADKIVVMDKGRIIEMGTYDELMEKKGSFYELKKLSEFKADEE